MGKRCFDVVVAATALLVLWPALLTAAAAVRIAMGPPVLFRQERPGRDGQPFHLLKFRTMTHMGATGVTSDRDDDRLPPLGWWLRRASLDELPQLWNVIRGDMSLVGPRPLLPRYMPYFTEHERIRFSVRPGITGLAQVRGRNLLGWDRRLAWDVWYVEHQCFRLDLRILYETLVLLARREGVVRDAARAMPDLDEERHDRGAAG